MIITRSPSRVSSDATKGDSLPSRPLRRAVFLDRDGVLNEAMIRNGKPHAPTELADLRIPPGTAEALARLKARDFLLLVVTNQPDVARGVVKRDTVEQMSPPAAGRVATR